jgi:hypothetical protein
MGAIFSSDAQRITYFHAPSADLIRFVTEEREPHTLQSIQSLFSCARNALEGKTSVGRG